MCIHMCIDLSADLCINMYVDICTCESDMLSPVARAKEVERQLGLARKYATVGWNLGNLCCLDTAKSNGE